jgi:hypothetical protein
MKKEIDFVEYVMEILKPMHNITIVTNKDNAQNIFKDGLKFGTIKDGSLYFIDNKTLQKLDKTLLNEPDKILHVATKSFWEVSGKLK